MSVVHTLAAIATPETHSRAQFHLTLARLSRLTKPDSDRTQGCILKLDIVWYIAFAALRQVVGEPSFLAPTSLVFESDGLFRIMRHWIVILTAFR